MDGLYLEVEDGRIIWYQTGHKGMKKGEWNVPAAPTALTLTEGAV